MYCFISIEKALDKPLKPTFQCWKISWFCMLGAGGHILWLGEVRRSSPSFVNMSCADRPCFSSSDMFFFCWTAFLSLSVLASVSLPLFFLFLLPCLIHAQMPDWGRAFVHEHTFLHSWRWPTTFVVGLLHGTTFLSNLTLVLFVYFIGRLLLVKAHIKSQL